VTSASASTPSIAAATSRARGAVGGHDEFVELGAHGARVHRILRPAPRDVPLGDEAPAIGEHDLRPGGAPVLARGVPLVHCGVGDHRHARAQRAQRGIGEGLGREVGEQRMAARDGQRRAEGQARLRRGHGRRRRLV